MENGWKLLIFMWKKNEWMKLLLDLSSQRLLDQGSIILWLQKSFDLMNMAYNLSYTLRIFLHISNIGYC